MSIKRAYYYLFYKLYRFWNKAYHPFLSSNFRAEATIIALEIWFLMGLINYYNIIIDRHYHLEKNHFVVAGALIVIMNYYFFIHTDVWKDYCRNFEKLPKKTNKQGSWVVFFIIFFIVAFVVFSFYLRSQIDWSQYR